MTVLSPIPLVNLKRQIENLRSEFDGAFDDLMERTDFVGGQAVSDFEAGFAKYTQATHCIGVGNGTDALYLIFRALGLTRGDEVIVPAMTFIATAEILAPMGLKPVFVDVDPLTYTMDPDEIASKVSPSTRAILPVHLYGQPADMQVLQELAEKHELFLIEDAAQAHGSEYNGHRIGSLGDAAAFSFYPGKNLGAFGDGGGVTTNDPEMAERIRTLANHGRMTKYEHSIEGVNSRLDTFQAAVLNIKLKRLDEWNGLRRKWAALYNELLADIPELRLPYAAEDRSHVYHLYVVQTAKRDELLKFLADRGIFAGIHYPIPLHLQPAFKYVGDVAGAYPISEALGNECLSLPIFPELKEEEVHAVSKAVHEFFRK